MPFQGSGLVKRLPRMAACAAAGLAATVGLVYAAAWLMASGAVGAGHESTLTALACAVSCAGAGFAAAGTQARQILPVGLITGGLYILLLPVCGALLGRGSFDASALPALGAAALAGACLGAFAAGLVPRRRSRGTLPR